jgi:hypothetical protein
MKLSGRATPRFSPLFAVGVALLISIVSAGVPAVRSVEASTVSGAVNLGDGLYTMSSVQQVNGSAYWDNFNCPSQTQFGWCVDALGLAYIAPAGLVVLSEANCPMPGCNGTRNSLVNFDPLANTFGIPLTVGCTPFTPYYPGTGNDYFVPCGNFTQGWSSILSVDYRTNSVVANISDPAGVTTMGFDSSSGMIFGGGSNGLEVINPATEAMESTVHVPNATFAQLDSWFFGDGSYTLVYDSATNSVIFPSTASQLLVVNPATGAIETTVRMPGAVESLAIDSSSNQLLVATVNDSGRNPNYAGAVSVFNAKTLALEARIPFPDSIGSFAGEAYVNQILTDPANGDAYLMSSYGLLILNLTTLSVVGGISIGGDGPPLSSVYVPSTDQILYNFPYWQTGPGVLVQLHHRSFTVLTSFMWLPPPFGVLILVVLAAVGVAVVAWVQVRRWWLRRRGAIPAPKPTRPIGQT